MSAGADKRQTETTMKRAGMNLWLMTKRMGRHPVYWVLILLFPAAVFAVPKWNAEAERERIRVGYVMEEPEESGVYKDRENSVPGETSELFEYIRYDEADGMKEDILTGKLSCGAVFDAEFIEKLRAQDYHHCITLYLPEGMNVGGMVQEDIFRRVYQAYSAVWYAQFLEQYGYQMEPEEVLRKFSEYQKEGKVFAVHYEVQAGNRDRLYGNLPTAKGNRLLSLRGILAFLTLMSALLGALDAGRDRRRKLGQGISCPGSLVMAATAAPIVPAVLFLAGGMLFESVKMTYVSCSGGAGETLMTALDGPARSQVLWAEILRTEFLPEIASALLYGLVLWIFALLLGRFIPEKLLEGAMPCFLMIVLLCCPVFFDPGEIIPFLRPLSKLFPITWYLEFWGG